MSCRLSGSWSSSQAATPIGESAMPYSVCGCHPMKNWVGMVLYKKASVSYACFSSAERPDGGGLPAAAALLISRSEEHTSELQSRFDLVCRLLLEKKKNNRHAT